MYMQKKTYVVPSFDVFELEGEPILSGADSFTENLPTDKEVEDSDPNDMNTQKKQYGFNSAPWE